MNLENLLYMHRAHYLDHFEQALNKAKGGGSEILLVADNYAPDPLYNLLRADYVQEIKGKLSITAFDLKGPMDHAIFYLLRGETQIEVRPFCWNKCIIQVVCDRFDRKALEGWATYWLDTEDTKMRDIDGFKQTIHFLSPPTYPMGKLAFLVDFGTAPVRAMLELIKIFQIEAGTKQIVIGAEF